MKKIVAAAILLLCAASGGADVPKLINFPGKLTSLAGSPLTGSYAITFKLYGSESSGNPLWTENQTSVAVTKGIFNAVLGSVTPFPASLDFNQAYWIELTVGSEVMLPRQKLTSVAYAMRAQYANQADTPVLYSGRGDIDANSREKAHLHLPSAPRSVKMYLYGEKLNQTYLNNMQVWIDGADKTAQALAAQGSFAQFGDGSAGHALNAAGGSGEINLMGVITWSPGVHTVEFVEPSASDGGKIRYYIYVVY